MTGRGEQWKGILSGPVDGPARVAAAYPAVPAAPGLTVRHRASGFTGKVVRLEAGGVELRGASGQERAFLLIPGAFEVEGRAVTLVAGRPSSGAPAGQAPAGQAPGRRAPAITASGSLAVSGARARVARASRILVEGVHDAELVERVWGDDLRVEGVVVERLDGADHLAEVVAGFGPGPGRRLGVLLDHLVDGSKESRLAAAAAGGRPRDVLVTGHPFVDIWQAVRPKVLGLPAWPEIPKGQDWKTGVCRAAGLGDPASAWRRILGAVGTYADLEPALVGAVERLIDFVTEPAE